MTTSSGSSQMAGGLPSHTGRPAGDFSLDVERRTVGGAFSAYVNRLRSGEPGALPSILGLIVLAAIFSQVSDRFLSRNNVGNLPGQGAYIAIIAMGLVFVLLLGEIDLSVGYVSGIGGVVAAVLLEPGKGVPTSVAILLALGAGAAIGFGQGFFVAKIRVPSFVVTLAGLLGWNGVVLLVIGSSGTIVIQNNFINGIANEYVSHTLAWVIA